MSELRKRKGVPLKDRNRNSSHANGGSKSVRAAVKLVPDENGGPLQWLDPWYIGCRIRTDATITVP